MRRPAVTVSATLLTSAVLVGSLIAPTSVARAQDDPVEQIACGTVGPPICDVVRQVSALLSPLGPVLDLAGPALGDLGRSVDVLTAILEGGPDLPAQDLAEAAGAVLVELDKLTGPVLDLLKGAGVDPGLLESGLTQLQALALDAVEQAAPSEPVPAEPAPSHAPSRPSTTAASASGPASFGTDTGPISGSSVAPGPARDLPEVPVGSTLSLAPLSLPDFRFEAPAAATDLALPDPITDAADHLIQPAAGVIDAAGEDGKALAVVMAVSTLLLAAGLLLDQQRRARVPLRVRA